MAAHANKVARGTKKGLGQSQAVGKVRAGEREMCMGLACRVLAFACSLLAAATLGDRSELSCVVAHCGPCG